MSSCTNVLSWAWSQPATIVPPNRQEIRRQSPRGLAMGTKAVCERIGTMAQISQLLPSIFLRNLSNGWSASLYKIHIQIWGFGKCLYCMQRFFPVCSGQLKRGGSFPGSLHAKHTIIKITSTLSMSHAPGKWKEPGLTFCLLKWSAKLGGKGDSRAGFFEGGDMDRGNKQPLASWNSSKSPQSRGILLWGLSTGSIEGS